MSEALRRSIVRIRTDRGAIAGAGSLVGNRLVLTAAHVVADALGLDRYSHDAPGDPVAVDFAAVAPDRTILAYVKRWDPLLQGGGGDIAVLELAEDSPDRASPLAVVEAGSWQDREFVVYGFPRSEGRGRLVEGRTLGPRPDGWVQLVAKPGDSGYWIEPGFSGSPVFDTASGAALGVIAEAETAPGIRAAFMIPIQVPIGAWPDFRLQVSVVRDREAPSGVEEDPLAEVAIAIRARLAGVGPEVIGLAARMLTADGALSSHPSQDFAQRLLRTTHTHLFEAVWKLRLDPIDPGVVAEVYEIAVPFTWVDPGAAARLHDHGTQRPRPQSFVAASAHRGLTGVMYVKSASRTHPPWRVTVVPPPIGEDQVEELVANVRLSIKEALHRPPGEVISDEQLSQRLALRGLFLVIPPPLPDLELMSTVCSAFPKASFLFLGGSADEAGLVDRCLAKTALLPAPIATDDEDQLRLVYEAARDELTAPV